MNATGRFYLQVKRGEETQRKSTCSTRCDIRRRKRLLFRKILQGFVTETQLVIRRLAASTIPIANTATMRPTPVFVTIAPAVASETANFHLLLFTDKIIVTKRLDFDDEDDEDQDDERDFPDHRDELNGFLQTLSSVYKLNRRRKRTYINRVG